MISRMLVAILITMFTINFNNSFAKDYCSVAKVIAKISLQMFQKNEKKALSGLIRANRMCPEDKEIAYDLGIAYYRYRRPDLAYKVWANLAKQDRRDFKLLSNLAWTAMQMGELNSAEMWFKRAFSIKRDRDLVYLQLNILFKKGKYLEALEWAKKKGLRKEESKAAEYLAETAWNKFRIGRKEEALRDIIEYCKKFPQEQILSEAKDKMALAMIDDSVIPLPKPLPDQVFKNSVGLINIPNMINSDVLHISRLKPTLKPTSEAYALIIGISRYEYLNGPRFADNDARQMYEFLIKRAGFMNDSDHIHLVLDEDATLNSLYNNIDWLIRKAKLHPGAKIFFYFSGHGSPVLQGEKLSDGLLVPYDATLEGLNERTAIPLSYLKRKFDSLKNKKVVVMLDACFSGTGKSVTAMKLIRPEINKTLLKSNKLFISAAASNKPALEYAPGREGAFTYFFLQGALGKADKNKDGWVDTLEAFEYAKSKLEALDYNQDPQISIRERIKLSKVR